MESRNVLFAIILSSIVLVFWATFFEQPVIDQKPSKNQTTNTQMLYNRENLLNNSFVVK